MALDKPPQTVREALELGWTHLEFTCKRKSCRHEGRVPLGPYDTQRGLRATTLWDVFNRCKCRACGLRPTTGSLAVVTDFQGLKSWHSKRVDFYEGMTLRPSRE